MARRWQSTEEIVLIYVVREIDLDALIATHEEQLKQALDAVATLSRDYASGDAEARSRWPNSEKLGFIGTVVIQQQARLEVLKELKAAITAQPPAARVQGREIEQWLDYDGPYSEYAFSKAYEALAANKLLRKWIRPKHRGCRYKFLKSPAEYPREYNIFRKMALHTGVLLYDNQTSFAFSWDFRRPAIIARVRLSKQ